MLRGVAAFRWGTWVWMAIVLALHHDALTRPVLASLLVGVAFAWTAAATLLMQSNPGALERAPAILGELAIGAALGIGGGIVYTHTTDPNTAFSSVRTLGFAWPIAGIVTAGIVFGAGRGALAGLLVALPRVFSPVVNGITFGQYRGGAWFSILSTLLLYILAGGIAGYMAALLRQANDEVAAARAREQVARTLHDGVLQTLAVIERRSDDPQLARLAREQERELREFLFSGNGTGATGADLGARLRAAAGRFETAFSGRVDVVIAPDLPRLDAMRVEALAAAVGEALTNAGKHGAARRVTVFAEPSDDGDGVTCSVHDDGRGFDPASQRRRRAQPVDPRAHDRHRWTGRHRKQSGRGNGGTPVAAVRVVLADDHSIWRSGVRADLGDAFQVVGEAGDAENAILVIRREKPDLVVCDLNMPNGGGLKVAKECSEQTCIVMLTVSEQERDLLDAVAAGAQGYLLKSTPGPELRAALLRASRGEPVFSPHLASLVLGEFRRMSKTATGANPLSDREREVLQHVARGYRYKDIGERLFISPKTVENHVRNILQKLHLNRKQELIRYAVEHGIE